MTYVLTTVIYSLVYWTDFTVLLFKIYNCIKQQENK